MKIIQLLFLYYTIINTVNSQSTYKENIKLHSPPSPMPSSPPPPPCCDYPPPAPQVIHQEAPIHNVPINNAPINNAPTPTPINSIYLTPTCQFMF